MTVGPDTLSILERLVGFPTVSRESNLPLIDWTRNFLADHAVESHTVPDPTGRKANLLATIGPMREHGLVLSGHTDVVPVDGQTWASDPFTLTTRGSRLHGRGTCDMKGFMAAVLARVPEWRRMRLSRPVHLMFSYDEEVGCLGVPSMIAAARELLPPPGAVIVGEPTGMRIATEHKGFCAMRTRVIGVEAHSSLTHQGISSVMLAGELIAQLGTLARQFATQIDPRSARFEPPYTTLSVNRISGGTAINILAADCEFEWEVRPVPGQRFTAIVEELTAFADQRLVQLLQEGKRCTVSTTVQVDVPALSADSGRAERLVRMAIQSDADSIAVPFATEGGQFQCAGWSTVVCGPGSIEQAHKPDEFIERADLAACEGFLDLAVAHQCM